MKITALAGGVGGAKLAHGFSKILGPEDFSVIVNTGDDFSHLGLYISPDVDTVTYMMADVSNPKTGWGRKNETFNTLNEISNLNGLDWFMLGDKDLAYHLVRTNLLNNNYKLSEITSLLSSKLGVIHKIIPMTDDHVHTIVDTKEYGEISFQEYFVKYKFEPIVLGFRFDGIEKAQLCEKAKNELEKSDLIVICPSNPYVSINPILNLKGVKEIISEKFVIGVSPIIGNKAVKGPLGKMLNEFDKPVNALSVVDLYKEFLDIFIIDKDDPDHKIREGDSSIIIRREEILLPDLNSRIRLAKKIINISKEKL